MSRRPLRRIGTRRVTVARGLTRAKAMRAALRKSKGDIRGFAYDPKTGAAALT